MRKFPGVIMLWVAAFCITVPAVSEEIAITEPLLAPEPIKLDSHYDWIVKEKIRMIYGGLSLPEFKLYKDLGINSAACDVHWHRPQIGRANLNAAKNHGLRVFATQHFIDDRIKNDYRKMVSKTGYTLDRTPCPLNEAYWLRVVGRNIYTLVSMSLDYPNLAGYLLDTEMYTADSSQIYRNHCYCKDCFERFYLADKKTQLLKSDSHAVKSEDRYRFLMEHELLADYEHYQYKRLVSICRRLRDDAWTINPKFLFGYYPRLEGMWFDDAFVEGMADSGKPVLALAETTYPDGYSDAVDEMVATDRARNALVVCGVYTLVTDTAYTVEQLAAEFYAMGTHSSGYWIFNSSLIRPKTMADYNISKLRDDEYQPERLKKRTSGGETTLGHTWKAIILGNRELDKRLRHGHEYKTGLKLLNHSWIDRYLQNSDSGTIYYFNGKPNLDGVLNDSIWLNEEHIIGMATVAYPEKYPDQPEEKTLIRAAYDRENLYISIDCEMARPSAPKADVTEHDGPVYKDDCVEIFLDTDHDQLTYYQIIANVNGAIYDAHKSTKTTQRQFGSSKWDSNAKSAGIVHGAGWSIELTIPFDSLGLNSPPSNGETWGLCVARNSSSRLLIWGGATHVPQSYAKVTFIKK